MLKMKKIAFALFCAMFLTAEMPFSIMANEAQHTADSRTASDNKIDTADFLSDENTNLVIIPSVYQFDEDFDLIDNFDDIIGGNNNQNITNIEPIGTLSVSDTAILAEKEENIDKYDVADEKFDIFYHFKPQTLTKKKEEWHLVSNYAQKINKKKLSAEIGKGAILIETSFDGEHWIQSDNITDYFSKKESSKPIYDANDVQLLNGCYFRILVAYQEEMKIGTKKGAFGKKKDKNKSRYVAEVYEFYAKNNNAESEYMLSTSDEPHTIWDEEYVKIATKKYKISRKADNILENKAIGHFTLNGYSQRKEQKEGTYTFIKDVGDKITLWFTLDQNINKLNGDKSIKVVSDKKGKDDESKLEKGDMGRGTLIVKYKDTSKQNHTPVVYRDYLAACSTTSADTKIALYQEGDYDIILDYKVHRSFSKGLKTCYYKMKFHFSIANGNTMFYPFDASTNSELQNEDITPHGFKISLANSKALDVEIKRSEIKQNNSGRYVEDVRSQEPAKEGVVYSKEGIYTLEAENKVTGQSTRKTIYVGDDPILKALSRTGKSVKELNDAIQLGYQIDNDGNLIKAN